VERATFPVRGELFNAVIHHPARSAKNGWGVLLIGGGVGNDLDWTNPGLLELDQAVVQVSINGQPHADAPAISQSLVDAGYVVLRWSTIAQGDPLESQWPVRATPRSLSELLEQAWAALELLRGAEGVQPDRIVLVGHSLGAARAVTVAEADPGVRAVAALSPAYFTERTRGPASFAAAGMRTAQDLLASRQLPVLAVFGELDTSPPVDAAGASALAERHEGVQVVTFDGLGHQLGQQEGDRHGPIDQAVLDHLMAWLHRVSQGESR
jgi:dienelactone hydrolase